MSRPRVQPLPSSVSAASAASSLAVCATPIDTTSSSARGNPSSASSSSGPRESSTFPYTPSTIPRAHNGSTGCSSARRVIRRRRPPLGWGGSAIRRRGSPCCRTGIGHIARISPLVAGAAVIPAIVYFNGERLGPDRVRLRHVGQHDLAVADDGDGEAFAQLFHGTPLRILLSSDFATLAWRKLLINAVANPVTALTLQRQAVFRRADVHALCIAILDEAVAVARADGARLADDESERTMATLLTYPPEAGTSMYFDRLAGRALEVEALTGAIVAAGERLGLATPLNRMLLTLLRAVSDAAGQRQSRLPSQAGPRQDGSMQAISSHSGRLNVVDVECAASGEPTKIREVSSWTVVVSSVPSPRREPEPHLPARAASHGLTPRAAR
jgi:hypothetical protein